MLAEFATTEFKKGEPANRFHKKEKRGGGRPEEISSVRRQPRACRCRKKGTGELPGKIYLRVKKGGIKTPKDAWGKKKKKTVEGRRHHLCRKRIPSEVKLADVKEKEDSGKEKQTTSSKKGDGLEFPCLDKGKKGGGTEMQLSGA